MLALIEKLNAAWKLEFARRLKRRARAKKAIGLPDRTSSLIEGLESRFLFTVTAVPAPTAFTATVTSPTSVSLSWTEKTSVYGFNILRSVDGVHFSRLTGTSATKLTDTTALSGHKYTYEVQAVTTTASSPVSAAATVITPLVAPAALTATYNNKTVSLTWTDKDSNAAGYLVLRSTDAKTFTQIGKLTAGNYSTFSDTTIATAHTYDYEVEAYDSVTTSTPSTMIAMKVPLGAPSALTATATITDISLAFTEADSNALGYLVLRSTDGKNFTQIASIPSASTKTYADSKVTPGTTYYYELEAVAGSFVSAASNIACTTAQYSVNITTRFNNELVITASGGSDSVTVSETGDTLTINADGITCTDPAPADGLFLYSHGGTDSFSIATSVTVATTVDSIDGAATTVVSDGAEDSLWVDSTDTVTGTDTTSLHQVTSFAGGTSKALRASLANPTDSGKTVNENLSLWGSGPVAGDVNQGEVGDCYFLSSLAAFAGTNPAALQQTAVDMGDGTYAVQFQTSKGPEYIRVSNAMPAGPFEGCLYAHPGTNDTSWAMVLEKAFADFRTGANTYASISSGWMGEVYSDFGIRNTFFQPSASSDSALYSTFSTDLASGKAVTLATSSARQLVNDHAYTLVSVSTDANGIHHYMVRNPWGVSGDSLENAQGYATLTYAQLVANFSEGCAAA